MLAAGVLLMAANTIANVFGRFVLQSSLFFSEELNSILIVLITFAGISYAARHGRHIRMSALFDTLPPSGRKAMMVLISLVTAVFMFGLCWFSVGLRRHDQAGQGRLLPSLQIPVFWMYRLGARRVLHDRGPVRADGREEPRRSRMSGSRRWCSRATTKTKPRSEGETWRCPSFCSWSRCSSRGFR